MASIEYISGWNGQAYSGLDRSIVQRMTVYCFVNNGTTGVPCADGTSVFVTEWVVGGWTNTPSPCTANLSGAGHGVTATSITTINGFALMVENFPTTAVPVGPGNRVGTRQGGWFVSLTNTPGTAPNFTYDMACTGGVNANDTKFASAPVMRDPGIPGDQKILWTWHRGVLVDDQNFSHSFTVASGTGASPSFSGQPVVTDVDQFLFNIGPPTNGTTYHSHIRQAVKVGNRTLTETSDSNIVSGVPNVIRTAWDSVI